MTQKEYYDPLKLGSSKGIEIDSIILHLQNQKTNGATHANIYKSDNSAIVPFRFKSEKELLDEEEESLSIRLKEIKVLKERFEKE